MATARIEFNIPEEGKKPPFKDLELYWPTEINGKYDHLQIKVVKYTPFSDTIDSSFLATSSSSTPTPSPAGSTPTTPSTPSTTQNLSNTQSIQNQEEFATVLLPVPDQINYSDSLNWNDEGIGAVGKLLPSIAKAAGAGNTDAMGASISTLAKQGLSGLISSKLNQVGINSDALTQGIAGKVLNPYREQIFTGIGMRNFNFSWKLVPRNKKEQLRIHQIINAIRFHGLPNYSGASAFEFGAAADSEFSEFNELSDRWLTVPNIFLLEWKSNEGQPIRSLPKIKPCVLKSINVSYTPDGVWATHYSDDPNLLGPVPVAYNLTMDFSETEIITGTDTYLGDKELGGY